MSGFPVRPDRLAFGPKPVNRYPVRDSAKELDGPTVGDLMMWQLAGCGLMVPRAMAIIAIDAFDVATLKSSAEAWDPASAYLPTLAHPGFGTFTLTYAATYPDKDGVAQATNLVAAAAFVQNVSSPPMYPFSHALVSPGGLIINVLVSALGGAADDPTSSDILVLAW